ncbi:hypothetical protein [Virgibacillus ainsalahensis]
MIYLYITATFLLISTILKIIQTRYRFSVDFNLWIFGSLLTISLILGSVGIGFEFEYSVNFIAYGRVLCFGSVFSVLTSYFWEKRKQ